MTKLKLMKTTTIILALFLWGCGYETETVPVKEKPTAQELENARWERKSKRLDSVSVLRDSVEKKTWYYLNKQVEHLGTKTGHTYYDSTKMCIAESRRLFGVWETINQNP